MICRRKWLGRGAGLVVAALLVWDPQQPAQAQAQGVGVVVFTAASHKNALAAINEQWQKETGKKAISARAKPLFEVQGFAVLSRERF